jgi:hypothetical protein
VSGDGATVELKYVCNLSYRPKFYAGRYTKGNRPNTEAVIFMGSWNAGPGKRLDRSRTIAATLTAALDWRRPMKTIVDEAGEIIAKATDDHILIGGHHRLAVAASLGKRLFWRDTGEPVKLDLFFKHYGSSLRHTA